MFDGYTESTKRIQARHPRILKAAEDQPEKRGPMNAKQLTTRKAHVKNFFAKIERTNRKEAKALVESMADVIMQNTWLAGEVASRWATKHGYYFTDAKKSDAEFARKYPALAAKVRKAQARRGKQ